ncbi:MAG: helix-turn-helix transcriptional regulator [Clostridia bacterium]|nr:helix-turn-helix transcriptional regulator [Clostridia bacterium]
MATTFGSRLKKFRKNENLTQQELAEALGVSVQAISKWETDTGMPDISQIVPLSRVLNVSADILLGIIDENDSTEFDEIYEKCMAIEMVNACKWPPSAEKAEEGFRLMSAFFESHPTHPRAAKYLLNMTELYWGRFSMFVNEDDVVKACERYASCIFRHSEDADLQAEARFLIASIWTRVGKKEKAEESLAKMPFLYGDRCYWSAEVAEKGGDYERAEALCKESFSYRARFLSRCLRLMAHLPNKSFAEQTAYEEYMLRIINALLSGGDAMPYRFIYQKMTLLAGLIRRHLQLGDRGRAVERFTELLETAEHYLIFMDGGSKGTTLMLLDDGLDVYNGDDDGAMRREMVETCLTRAIRHCEKVDHELLHKCVEKAEAICGSLVIK